MLKIMRHMMYSQWGPFKWCHWGKDELQLMLKTDGVYRSDFYGFQLFGVWWGVYDGRWIKKSKEPLVVSPKQRYCLEHDVYWKEHGEGSGCYKCLEEAEH